MSYTPPYILIPARLSSSRLPKKLLIQIAGLPVIEHVRRRAVAALSNDKVIICTPDEEIASVVQSYGGQIFLSQHEHSNGTLRCLECAIDLQLESFVLLQGDEILLTPEHITKILDKHLSSSSSSIINSVSPITSQDEVNAESVVKALSLDERKVNYLFRRSPLISSFQTARQYLFKLNGLMSVSTHSILQTVPHFDSQLVLEEKIEQLAYLLSGVNIELFQLSSPGPSLDTDSDLNTICDIIETSPTQISLINSY